MKTIILALILSITLHLLFLYNYKVQKVEKTSNNIEKKQNDKKSSITYVRIKPKVQEVKKPKPIIKELPKKVEKPRLLKKPKKVVEKKKPVIKKPKPKKAKKIIPVKKQEQKIIKKEFKKVPKEVKPTPRRKTIEKKSLENLLLQPDVNIEILDDLTKSYLALYGDEFKKFTQVQKAYLRENLKPIHRITQTYLNYICCSKIAFQKHLKGMNIVEFDLLPNGDITEIKLLKSSGYDTLDKTTIRTIEAAFKDYPRPKETTKIRIYVVYEL